MLVIEKAGKAKLMTNDLVHIRWAFDYDYDYDYDYDGAVFVLRAKGLNPGEYRDFLHPSSFARHPTCREENALGTI